jgi:hypothetical protein
MRRYFENEKIKNRLAMVLLMAVIAVPLIYIEIGNLNIDFLPDRTGWHKILDGDDYRRMTIHGSDNTLFAWDSLGGNTITMYSPESGKVSALKAPVEYIDGLCIRDLLWLGQPGSPGLISYDFQKEIWYSHAETEAFGEDFGWLVTKDGTLMVYGHDFLKEYVDRQWSPNLWTPDEVLWSVFQDEQGTIWAKTAYNELYAFSQDHQWNYIGQLRNDPSILRITDGKFWLAYAERLFLWDSATPEIAPESIRDFSDDVSVRCVIENEPDMYYIITTSDIWRFQNGEWENVKIPNLVKRIRTAVFDEALQRMYLSTDRGVYYKDLPL